MNFLKTRLWIVLIGLTGIFIPAESQTMHAILVGDLSKNGGIGGGVQQDLDRVYNELSFICHTLQLELESTMLSTENQFEREAVLSELNKIPEQADIIFFYYSGHGYCQEKDNLPFLQIYGGLHIQEVIQAIREKQSRLAILLTDCCNGPPPQKYYDRSDIRSMPSQQQQANLAFLFQSFRGEIIGTASRYGQEAYISPNGSYFTQAFFDALQSNTTNEVKPNWGMIFNQAQQETRSIVERVKFDQQVPYYRMSISRIK
ncbi:caspase family protein [Phaeodactylibacter xiamenensis]|uniref:caspase family protein n=1 Tax=Phaeodactylibacter xiamenensis TaxID=1524460 RepID=UPI0024A7F902|nr:caspase family protein [Phaeodactylibacter xiamenensis]